MANPLKFLTGVSASSGLDISGGNLTIANSRVAAASEVTGAISNLASRAEVTGALGSYSTTSNIRSEITGAFTPFRTEVTGAFTPFRAEVTGALGSYWTSTQTATQVTGALAPYSTTTSIRTEITGAISSFPSRAEVSGAIGDFPNRTEVSGAFVAKDGSGNVTISGDLTVNGTTTTVNTTNLLVEDAIIQLGSSSAGNAAADGDRGFIFSLSGSDSKTFFWDDSDSRFKVGSTQTSAGSSTISTSSAANLEVGSLFFSSSINSGDLSQAQDGSGPFLMKTGSNNLETILSGVIANLGGGGGGGVNASSINNAYQGLRTAGYITFAAGTTNKIVLALSGATDQGSYQYTTNGEVTYASGSTLSGMLSNSQFGENSMEYLLANLSVDVAVKASGSKVWTNDLVAVQLSSSLRASDSKYVPVIVIEAPGLGEGNGQHYARVVVVNEDKYGFNIS